MFLSMLVRGFEDVCNSFTLKLFFLSNLLAFCTQLLKSHYSVISFCLGFAYGKVCHVYGKVFMCSH